MKQINPDSEPMVLPEGFTMPIRNKALADVIANQYNRIKLLIFAEHLAQARALISSIGDTSLTKEDKLELLDTIKEWVMKQ